eukprot:10984881-Heterocapsa_arctica.AAC.1
MTQHPEIEWVPQEERVRERKRHHYMNDVGAAMEVTAVATAFVTVALLGPPRRAVKVCVIESQTDEFTALWKPTR